MRDFHSFFRRCRRGSLFLPFIVWLISGPPAAHAATYLIRPDGSGDFPTIQAGIDAPVVQNGDVLELADGIFSGPGNRDLDYVGKAITIRSQSGNAAACVIDAEGAGRGFYFRSGEGPDSRLERVTITRGFAEHGGGIYSLPGCSPSFTGCRFENNEGASRGGGLTLRGGSSMISDCAFTGNSASIGGGFYALSSSAALVRCSFTGNTAQVGGGASYNVDMGPVAGCTFESNFASEAGGGLYLWSADPDSVTDCAFLGNQSMGSGGAIRIWSGSSAGIRRCAFSGNEAHEGAGISLENGCSAEIRDCQFLGNTGYWGVGVAVRDGSNVTLVGCVLAGNEAANRAAAVYASGAAAVLNDCTVYRNRAGLYGGALCAYQSTISAGWCTFSENSSDFAGVAFGYDNATFSLQRSILAFNAGGPAIGCGLNASADLVCCDVYGNAGGDWVDCLEGMNDSHGNFSADPLFCDPPNGDYRLARDSPCAAENSPFGCGPIGAWPVGCEAPASGIRDADPGAAPAAIVATPNPSAGTVRLVFEIAPTAAGRALRLVVCDVTGRVVRGLIETRATPGRHAVVWDGRDRDGIRVPSGIYGWRLELDGTDRTGRFTVLR